MELALDVRGAFAPRDHRERGAYFVCARRIPGIGQVLDERRERRTGGSVSGLVREQCLLPQGVVSERAARVVDEHAVEGAPRGLWIAKLIAIKLGDAIRGVGEAWPLVAARHVGRFACREHALQQGDGARWRAADLPPADPTPENPLALRLAIQDGAPAVAYLGRPCQYLDDAVLAECDPALWTRGRYSEEAIAIELRALEAVVKASGATHLTLIGHSGGGAMAALLAARRNDVACLSTLASPLDIVAWTSAIGVSPLRSSINPLDQAARLTAIPQVHFTGGRDDTVPPASIERYLRVVPQAREVRFARYDHDCCWVDEWVKLRAQACPADPARR